MLTLQRSFLAFCLIATAMAETSSVSNSSVESISYSANTFSNNFVKAVAQSHPKNIISSPLSTYLTLAMAATGSAGATAAQFQVVLNLPFSKGEALPGLQNLINSLNNVENVTLKLANKIFINENFPIKSQYKQELQTYYYSDIESLNFNEKSKALDVINSWCKEKTNDRIKSIINEDELNPLTALVLANAVYFKGKWANEFDPKATIDRPFHIDANNVKNVPTMFRKGNYRFVDMPQHKSRCIELPYANKEISMIIILPYDIDGLSGLLDNLPAVTHDCYNELSQTYKREIELYLPRFKTETKLDLANQLSEKMNLDIPFTNRADFSGISDVPLKISKIVQKAFIEVNEEGSEAAAVTGVVTVFSAIYMTQFDINRPFLYTIVKIQENKGGVPHMIPLFAGQIANPE